MIENVISFAVVFLLGFYIGRKNDPDVEKVKYRTRKLGRVLTGINRVGTPSGIVYRPNADKLRLMKRDGKAKSEAEAWKETLDNIPEIAEAKKELEKGV